MRLSRQETTDLFKRYKATGCKRARDRLTESNLGLVHKIATKYASQRIHFEDLFQEGCIGLLKAIDKFDLDRGVPFGAYASLWIRQRIMLHMMQSWRLVKNGSSIGQRRTFWQAVQERPTAEARISVTHDATTAYAAQLFGDVSLGDKELMHAIGEIHAASRGEIYFADPAATEGYNAIEERTDRDAIRSKLRSTIDHLNERERDIVHSRILAEEPLRLQDLADRYGLSRERVRQIEAKIIAKIAQELINTKAPHESYGAAI